MTTATPIDTGHRSLDAIRNAIDKRLGDAAIKLPMMPQVASQIMVITMDPNADVADLSKLIHKDPALAARVVQVANSAAYAGGQELDSLQDAVNRLGLSTLSEITLSASLHSGVFRAPGLENEVNQLWKHSLASAYYGKEVARLTQSSSEGLFLCGMLHAIGKPVVLQLIAEVKAQYSFSVKPDAIATLLDEFGREVSTFMAQQWKLPQHVQIACSHFNRYSEAPACKEEAAATYLADRLASRLSNQGDAIETSLEEDPVLETLRLNAADLAKAFEEGDNVRAHVSALS